MNRKMQFIPQLQRFLKTHKMLYAVKRSRMNRASVSVANVGMCIRYPQGRVKDKDDLIPYVTQSGFQNVEEWWSMIWKIPPKSKKPKLYLYRMETFSVM